jgi:hypothetical protein
MDDMGGGGSKFSFLNSNISMNLKPKSIHISSYVLIEEKVSCCHVASVLCFGKNYTYITAHII